MWWPSTGSGLCNAEGEGVPQNDTEAIKWYRRAAGLGRHGLAQLHLGRMHDMGRGVPRNHAIAMKWYRLAAAQGNAMAQTTLALIYDTGRGVPQNYWQAVKWYRLAAEQGVPVAQNNLGVIYQKGRAVCLRIMSRHCFGSASPPMAATGMPRGIGTALL
jgi:uncharacterized protein